jgi:hypothetical protein
MLVALGLLIAFLVVLLYARRNRGLRRCRWRADSTGDRGTLRKYRCAACGAEAFTAEKGAPRRCHADLPKT